MSSAPVCRPRDWRKSYVVLALVEVRRTLCVMSGERQIRSIIMGQ